MRKAAIAAAMTLAACQTTSNVRMDPEAAMAKLPASCSMRITFPDAVVVADDTTNPSLAPGSRDITLTSTIAGARYAMGCTCSPGANSALMTQSLAKQAREKDLGSDGWIVTDSKFTDAGYVKTITDRAIVTNYAGDFVRKMIARVEGSCIMAAEGMGRLADEMAIDRFLATFRDSRALLSSPDTVTVPRSLQPRTNADRLRELQALRDQGLITATEFEERRKAVVGGL